MNVTDPPLQTTKRSAKREYRVFLLGSHGRITGSRDIEAYNDEEAIVAARELKLPCKCEVWERARVLAELPAYRGF